MIFQLTYISEGLKVKGYLAIPNDIDISLSNLKDILKCVFNGEILPVAEISCSIVAKKKDLSAVKLPVLIFCRGGIGRYGRVKMNWIEEFASYGYIVFAPSYRGNEGSEGRDEFGGKDKEEVLTAYRIVSNLPFVNQKNISILGFSRGAINATLTAINTIDIKALILWSGVADLSDTFQERVDLQKMLKRVIGSTPTRKKELYDARSPVKMVKHIHCPVLLIHGTDDNQVRFSHSEKMYSSLLLQKNQVSLHSYKGYGHHFPIQIHQLAVRKMYRWLNSIDGIK